METNAVSPSTDFPGSQPVLESPEPKFSGADVLTRQHFRLQVGSAAAKPVSLDSFQSQILNQIMGTGDGKEATAAVVLGNPGAGRTTLAVSLVRAAHARGRAVRLLVPDRLRADILQGEVESYVTDQVRPVRTCVALAYEVVARHEVSLGHESPLLLTGAQEDLILAELLAANVTHWPENLATTIATQAFRSQLRNLMARTREVNWRGSQLSELGRQLNRPVWVAAGELMEHWDATIAVASGDKPARLNSAQLETRAAQLLSDPSTEFEVETVVVDDLQDMTAATLRMLVAMVKRGVKVWVTSNPDIAVASYRGGEPHLHGRFQAATGASVYNLGPTHRGPLGIQRLVAAVTNSITGSGDLTRRRLGAVWADESLDRVRMRAYGSPSQEANAVAQEVARLLLTGYQPTDIAILTRSQIEVERLKLACLREEIPITVRARALTYATDAVARPLLEALVSSNIETGDEVERYNRLAASVLFNITKLHLQRVVDVVVGWRSEREEITAPVALAVARVLKRELTGQADSSPIASPVPPESLMSRLERHRLTEVAKRMIAVLDFLECGGQLGTERPDRALWELWKIAGVEGKWTQRALQETSSGSVYDDRLDTVISLLRSADVWQQRNPHGDARQFADELIAQTLPTDTLAVGAIRPAGVHILTASQAVGQEWKAVFVVGLNEDQWPRRQMLDGITQARDVTDLASGRTSVELLTNGAFSYASARQASRDDEYRSFAAALSRATHYLHLSAVSNATFAPSQMLLMLTKVAQVETDEDGLLPLAPVTISLRPPALMAQLRRKAALEKGREERDPRWEGMLALLYRLGFSKADPQQWSFYRGQEISERDRSDADDAAVQMESLASLPVLSPSKISMLLECPLRVFLSSNSGTGKTSAALENGNLIHDIAQSLPAGRNAEMLAELEAKIRTLGIEVDTELGRKRVAELRSQVACLASIFDRVSASEVEVETSFSVKVEDAIIRGRTDRLEFDEDGVVVVDIKTGSPANYTDNKAQTDGQLRLYQYALGYPDGNYRRRDPQTGQETIYPVKGARWYATKRDSAKQPPMVSLWDKPDEIEKVREDIAQAARLYRGPVYEAKLGSHCVSCDFKNCCPQFWQGEQILS